MKLKGCCIVLVSCVYQRMEHEAPWRHACIKALGKQQLPDFHTPSTSIKQSSIKTPIRPFNKCVRIHSHRPNVIRHPSSNQSYIRNQTCRAPQVRTGRNSRSLRTRRRRRKRLFHYQKSKSLLYLPPLTKTAKKMQSNRQSKIHLPGLEANCFLNSDIQVLKTYGAAPYASDIKRVEKELKELQKKVNEKIGI